MVLFERLHKEMLSVSGDVRSVSIRSTQRASQRTIVIEIKRIVVGPNSSSERLVPVKDVPDAEFKGHIRRC